jgi:hypothetical protein
LIELNPRISIFFGSIAIQNQMSSEPMLMLKSKELLSLEVTDEKVNDGKVTHNLVDHILKSNNINITQFLQMVPITVKRISNICMGKRLCLESR